MKQFKIRAGIKKSKINLIEKEYFLIFRALFRVWGNTESLIVN